MRVCLFEDRHVENLEPLTLTRPAFELLSGQFTLAARQWRYFAPCSTGALVRPHLEEVQRQEREGVHVNDMAWLRSGATVMVNARWLPPTGSVADFTQPCVAVIDDEVAYAIVGPEMLTYCSANTIDDCLDAWKRTLPRRPVEGKLFRYLWELVDHNGNQIIADFEEQQRGMSKCSPLAPRAESARGASGLHTGVAVVGPRDQLLVDPAARLDPMVVVDTTNGPVIIESEAVVTAFTRLEGPCWIGPNSQVLGAKIRAGTSIGPQCRVGGEVEASILLGRSNKYHDGFLGHSYIGEWVNLGAGTSNSDLRNDYGPVVVTVGGRRIETGRSKVGCFLGDHTKTGLGTLLNTGTSAGVFCNLLPTGGLLPKYVPSFCNVWNGALSDNPDLLALLETARKVMARRGRELTDSLAGLYQQLRSLTALERQRGLREAEQRRLRRSA
jgi:UDP-N-acetylglucosamine diphosphorylase/glucosamine-1-phosphate N-acetyltransferase